MCTTCTGLSAGILQVLACVSEENGDKSRPDGPLGSYADFAFYPVEDNLAQRKIILTWCANAFAFSLYQERQLLPFTQLPIQLTNP